MESGYRVTLPREDAQVPERRVPDLHRNLYRVNLRGAQYGLGSPHQHFVAYVVASGSDEAYETVRRALADANIGTDRDRQLTTVELIAAQGQYPNAECTLYIKG